MMDMGVCWPKRDAPMLPPRGWRYQQKRDNATRNVSMAQGCDQATTCINSKDLAARQWIVLEILSVTVAPYEHITTAIESFAPSDVWFLSQKKNEKA